MEDMTLESQPTCCLLQHYSLIMRNGATAQQLHVVVLQMSVLQMSVLQMSHRGLGYGGVGVYVGGAWRGRRALNA